MSEPMLDLDFALELDEVNRSLLVALATRIEESTTPEHMIYRELELDQVWRLLEGGEQVAGLSTTQTTEIAAQIEPIHDLIGVHHDVRGAAAQLRALLSYSRV